MPKHRMPYACRHSWKCLSNALWSVVWANGWMGVHIHMWWCAHAHPINVRKQTHTHTHTREGGTFCLGRTGCHRFRTCTRCPARAVYRASRGWACRPNRPGNSAFRWWPPLPLQTRPQHLSLPLPPIPPNMSVICFRIAPVHKHIFIRIFTKYIRRGNWHLPEFLLRFCSASFQCWALWPLSGSPALGPMFGLWVRFGKLPCGMLHSFSRFQR